METRIALISIIIEDLDSTSELNSILHNFNEYIIGRMGIPYKAKHVNIISVAVDAPADKINSLTGLLGKLSGVSAKATFQKGE